MSLLVCPVCHGELRTAASSVECAACRRNYPVRTGHPDLILNPAPDQELAEKWRLWERLQENGEVSYARAPKANLSIGRRADARAFAGFCKLEGMVLDVGCGPQRLPSYGSDFAGTLVGIDPLVGSARRDFLFAMAIGEYLPFRDATFDRVLFATSLDHVMSPGMVLREARRVTKPSGSVNLWFGLVPHCDEEADCAPAERSGVGRQLHTALRMLVNGEFRLLGAVARERLGIGIAGRSAKYLKHLERPEGAMDQFHAFHLDIPMAENLLSGADLVIDEIADCGDGNVFVRSRPRAADEVRR
ncbi:MAG: methyltransferase domain-containing protein [Actinobacteria bacterium]|nr:methyltransferase domain-containing protein [Actinomycetota bacterium]